jgi:hypothetical protein
LTDPGGSIAFLVLPGTGVLNQVLHGHGMAPLYTQIRRVRVLELRHRTPRSLERISSWNLARSGTSNPISMRDHVANRSDPTLNVSARDRHCANPIPAAFERSRWRGGRYA